MAKNNTPRKAAERRDLGFGNRLFRQGLRLINPDGSFNVTKVGRSWFRPYDFYNGLLTMSWGRFALLVFLYYFTINLVFSFLYLLVGIENLEGTMGESPFGHFLDSFFFSAQTITTLGYGRISPVGTPASVVAAIESLIGLLGFALITGLLYGRFSRPVARIKFSKEAIVAPYKEGKGLMFRIANERSSELIEVEVQFIMSYINPAEKKRDFKRLELELNKVNFLSLSWTVVHPIEEESPLWGIDEQGLCDMDAEFLILIKGFDDTFSQTVYQRFSYRYHEIVWGVKFNSIITPDDGNRLRLELDRISEWKRV